VLWAAGERLISGGAPSVTALSFTVMGATFLINLGVVIYERREGFRLSSEVLVADAHHTQSDLLTSATVIAALIAVQWGYPALDPIAALVVAVFIGHACWGIFKETSRILADQIVIAADDISAVVHSVPNVIGCHQIRSRGSVDHVFLDLHLWLDPEMRLDDAHRISHEVKDRIIERYPQVKDAVIHIEPPPKH
jgi:cation diffusion facilitator family transporter